MKVEAPTVGPLPSAIIKMEDRKRAAGQNVNDLAPPAKRQVVNGGSKTSHDADMPWKDDLEVRLTYITIYPNMMHTTTKLFCGRILARSPS